MAGENTNRRLRQGVSRCLRALINIVFFWGGEGGLRPSPCLSQFSRRWRGNFFSVRFSFLFCFCFVFSFPHPPPHPLSSFLPVPCASATLIIFPSPPPPPVRNSPRVHTASQATNRARNTQGKQKKEKRHRETVCAINDFRNAPLPPMPPASVPLPLSPPSLTHYLQLPIEQTLRRDTVQALYR